VKAVAQCLKHILCGGGSIPRILFGAGRLTDQAINDRLMSGKYKYPETVDVDLCLGCGVCSRICPMKCITMKPLPEKVKLREGQYKDKYPEINHGQCMFCFQCHDNCPTLVAYGRQAAIHPRGNRKSGIKAEDLFKQIKAGGAGGA